MLDKIISETAEAMAKVKDSFALTLAKIHGGRANPAIIEDIKVNHYNTLMPLKQLATIAVPDPTSLTVSPWDTGALVAVETAIRESGLNLAPVNDGTTIRIKLPALSVERRRDLIKLIEQAVEDAKIALRQVREDGWRQVKELVRAGKLTEDDRYRGEMQLNKTIAKFNDELMAMAQAKEASLQQ